MVIARERYLDDTPRYHLTLSLSTRTGELHSLVSALPPEAVERIGGALVRALDEVQAALAPAIEAGQKKEADHFGCGT
jgi:hypothetical protein